MKIAILGSGPLGLALSINFSKHKFIDQVVVYSRKNETIAEINNYNRCIFENINLSNKICATNNLSDAIEKCDTLFITVNSNGLIDFLKEIVDLKMNFSNKLFILCSKGMDEDGFFIDIAKNILKTEKIALLLGPSFAHEIACGEKTFVNLVYDNAEDGSNVINKIVDENTNLKMIQISDYIGAQLCAVMKNICAIYLGIAKGFDIKNDYLAVMFKFFLDEIRKAIKFYNGEESTIFDFCGIGDIFLTCTSFDSRNYSFGYKIGVNKSVQRAFELSNNYYPEGYYGLKNLIALNKKYNLDLGMCNKIYNALFTEDYLFDRSLFDIQSNYKSILLPNSSVSSLEQVLY